MKIVYDMTTKQRIKDVIESTQEEKNRALEARERLGYDAVRNFLYKYIISDNSFIHGSLLIKYTSFINSLKFDSNGKPEIYVLDGMLESNKNLALEILSLFLEYRTFYTIDINRIDIYSVINAGADLDKREDLEKIKTYFAHKYDIIYTGENRGVFLKNNIEIVQAIQETKNDELIDIIKSATNRVGVVDLTEQLRSLNNFLEASVDGKKGFSWFESFVKHKFDDKDHPIASMMRNFQQAMNRCNIRHSHDQHHEKPSLEIQRILLDMGLTLARLKLEFQNLENVIKNEQ